MIDSHLPPVWAVALLLSLDEEAVPATLQEEMGGAGSSFPCP